MADTAALSTSGASGTQTSTSSPQTATQPSALAGQAASGVQPGGSTSLNESGTGSVSLTSGPLTTVALGSSTTASTAPATVIKHHVYPFLYIIPIVLVVAALLMFRAAANAEKDTTN